MSDTKVVGNCPWCGAPIYGAPRNPNLLVSYSHNAQPSVVNHTCACNQLVHGILEQVLWFVTTGNQNMAASQGTPGQS